MSEKRIECYKCGKFLGIIRDGLLHKDLYYICGKCVRPVRQKSVMPDFMKEVFGGFDGNKTY